MKTICYKKRAQEKAIALSVLGVTTAAAGMALGGAMPRSGAMLTGFGTANLLLGGLYYLAQ